MKLAGFFALCLLWIDIASAFNGRLFKHFSEPKPEGGGILDIIKKPKIPGVNIQLGGGGASFGIGSFGFGFGFGGQYVPPGSEVNLPPKDPHIPDVESHVPDWKPEIPDWKPEIPDWKPEIPDVKPQIPGVPWEKEKGKPRPNWEEYDEDDSKHGSYGGGKVDNPKQGPYEESKEDPRPAWEDIGENPEDNSDLKSEKYMDKDFIKEGLIQPRLNRRRSKRFIESHVYHVPLLFRSNAKPYQVKVQSNPNSLIKEAAEK